jgi:lipopolysaccharide/colanic/teichoic acid biosynthesis glycosyltransferase
LRHDSSGISGTYSHARAVLEEPQLTHVGQAARSAERHAGRMHAHRLTLTAARDARVSKRRLDEALKRTLDVVVAAPLLLLLAPVLVVIAAVIKLESPGGVFYRCRRVGRGGRELQMLKFRKMHDGARGPALVQEKDERFTRLGPLLARTKLDELPQLWNVLKGDMSLVGPRPEDPTFVEQHRDEYEAILAVRPGVTGLSQLAFARESEVLDPSDRVGHYTGRILPQKMRMDRLYAQRRSLSMDLKILLWTFCAVVGRLEVAVHRDSGRLNKRTPRPTPAAQVNSPVQLERQAS